MGIKEELEKHPHLLQELKDKRLCLFIGAGISKAAGLPMWKDLVKPLADEIGVPNDTDPIDIAQYYVNDRVQGRHLLNKKLFETLSTDGLGFSPTHGFISELPVAYLLTTNYDELLEKYLYKKWHKTPHRIVTDGDIAYEDKSDPAPTIIKLNGCLSRRETIVLTKDDYNEYFESRPQIKAKLSSLLTGSTFLYLGTSLSDPALQQINYEVLSNLPNDKPPSYIVTINKKSHYIQDLKSRGFEVINIQCPDDQVDDEVNKLLETLVHIAVGFRGGESPVGEGLIDLLSTRYGTGASLLREDHYVDKAHKYEVLFREDHLDYTTGDFYSIRRIKGTNGSTSVSKSLCYVECSEHKLTFKETKTIAFDKNTSRKLLVSPVREPNERVNRHPFKIIFDKPLQPGDDFDIIYCIRLPGELNVLSEHDEIMSISLRRICHPVSHLTFNVCLNFEPESVTIEARDDEGNVVPCDGNEHVVSPFTPHDWLDEQLNIDWSSEAFRVSWDNLEPKYPLYIIHYYRRKTDD